MLYCYGMVTCSTWSVATSTGTQLSWGSDSSINHVLQRFHGVHATAAEVAECAGDFLSDNLGATYKISVKREKLIVMAGCNKLVPLLPSLHDEFRGHQVGEFHEAIDIEFARSGHRVTGFDLFAGIADGVRGNLKMIGVTAKVTNETADRLRASRNSKLFAISRLSLELLEPERLDVIRSSYASAHQPFQILR
jgi:hypothetical protein